jgi:UDP-glucose 4-epimerase
MSTEPKRPRDKKLVVVASTSEVYGKGTVFPFREDADLVLGPPDKTRRGCAASKLIDEFLALAYWKEQSQGAGRQADAEPAPPRA